MSVLFVWFRDIQFNTHNLFFRLKTGAFFWKILMMRYPFSSLHVFALVVCCGSQTVKADFANNVLDWCTGGEPITWVETAKESVSAKIAAGARMQPIRNNDGKIDDLDLFVKDRLSTIPSEARMGDLPTLIIENDCASVTEATDACGFDSAGTPEPHNFAIEKGIIERSNWEVKKSFTVVFVPAANTGKEGIELTSSKKKKHLASMKVRGNSSRGSPKKQFQIKFPKPVSLIPGTPRAAKWIISTKLLQGQPDKTYVGNPAIFESYRRYGELQKKYSMSWPKEGSVEDLATRAWSPHTLPVVLIFQGRFIGVYNVMEKVEVLEGGGRVWMPDKKTKPELKEIEGVEIPKGNYFLRQDAKVGEGYDWWGYSFMFPTYPDWVGKELGPLVGQAYPNLAWAANVSHIAAPAMTIDYPDDVTFLEYEQDEEKKDVSKLRNLLKKMMEWADDPVANDHLLAQVIDMKSFARSYLTEEITREGDAYVVSQKWKFIKGKLYHASLWDFGGNSFMATCADGMYSPNTKHIDYETTVTSTDPCDESTGYFYTENWHVDSMWDTLECVLYGDVCYNLEFGATLNETKVYDIRHFFRHLFRAPSLQKEFWSLYDIVEEHGLVDDVNDEKKVLDDDVFNFGALIDTYHEQLKDAAEVDLQIWSIPNVVISMMQDTNFPNVSEGECKPLLYEYLSSSGVNNFNENVTLIPANDWSFDQASRNSIFFAFFETAAKNLASATVMLNNWNWPAYTTDEAVTSAKEFIKLRLEWIGSQRENNTDFHVAIEGTSGLRDQDKARPA